jgi:hypothetical protein
MILEIDEDQLKQWVPSLSPTRWFIINECLLFYTLAQFSIIVMSVKDSGAKPTVAASYILWNFSTTIVWCFESGLESWWIIRTGALSMVDPEKDLSSITVLAYIIELSVALYFLFDSIIFLLEWQVTTQDKTSSLFDVTLNSAIYFYAAIRDFMRIVTGNVKNQLLEDESKTYVDMANTRTCNYTSGMEEIQLNRSVGRLVLA